jgi:hypothetical protein
VAAMITGKKLAVSQYLYTTLLLFQADVVILQ